MTVGVKIIRSGMGVRGRVSGLGDGRLPDWCFAFPIFPDSPCLLYWISITDALPSSNNCGAELGTAGFKLGGPPPEAPLGPHPSTLKGFRV